MMPDMPTASDAEILSKVNSIKENINQHHLDLVKSSQPEEVLKDMLESANTILLSSDAKRIRAIIPVLIAETGVCDTESVMRYGVLIELLHFTSLIHDDVIDEAAERRKKPCLNALYSNSNAVLIGDHFICETIEYALQAKYSTIVIGQCMKAVKNLIAGVIMEQELVDREIGFDTWKKMADLKTGCLFGLSFGLPFAGTDKLEEARKFGVEFGTLFQIYDDYLDKDEDVGSYNIYNVIPENEIDGICNRMYREISEWCARTGLSSVLETIVKYLESHGYFFNINM